MTEDSTTEIPQVVVRRRRLPSPVWLVPLVAVLVGAWLVYQRWSQRGPQITIHFASAEGIEAGKTEVRYKAVTVGKVREVSLDAELNPVVRLELTRDIGRRLQCSARFWVVRPRVRGAEISGLGTLFSGTYIGMTPQHAAAAAKGSAASSRCHQALDEPPPIKPLVPGHTYVLAAETMGSLSIGSSVYYKQLPVGEIVDFRLSRDSGEIELDAFIRAPFHRLVRPSSRFWNVSGAELEVTSGGAKLRVESLASLLAGGVAFETPPSVSTRAPSQPGTRFVLHRDHGSSLRTRTPGRLLYVMYFSGTVRGLSAGAPVELQGIPVGRVERIQLRVNARTLRVHIPVIVSLEPGPFAAGRGTKTARRTIARLVARGLRARLHNGNLLTGQLLVALDMDRGGAPARIRPGKPYPVFPTSPTQVEQLSRMGLAIASDLRRTMAGVRGLVESKQVSGAVVNLNGVLTDARAAVADARALIKTVGQQTLPGVSADVKRTADGLGTSFKRVQATLGHLDRLLSSGSPTQHRLREVLVELTAAARSLRALAETLDRQPESMIRGKRGKQ